MFGVEGNAVWRPVDEGLMEELRGGVVLSVECAKCLR